MLLIPMLIRSTICATVLSATLSAHAGTTYAVTELGTLGGLWTYAYGINNAGQVTGLSATASGLTHAFVFGGGAMTDLGVPAGGSSSQGYGINSTGQVAGSAFVVGDADSHAFTYNAGSWANLASSRGRTPQVTSTRRSACW